MAIPNDLRQQITLPVIAAPMFLVSGPELAIAACRAGIIGSLPALNARNPELFEQWLEQVYSAIGNTPDAGPLAVNCSTKKFGGKRWEADMALIERYQVPIVITAIGDPTEVVERVHGYGGRVFHDATTLAHARKAAQVGVDGINVICGGAGGHAGLLNPFAFLPQIREFFDGILCLAGSISNGASIRAAQVLGADLCYMGTRFIATQESMASPEYKQMLVDEDSSNVLYTDSVAGMPGNFLKASMASVGIDPNNPPPPKAPHIPNLPEGVKPWKHIWSAGQGIGLIKDVPSTALLVQRLQQEYHSTFTNPVHEYGNRL
ncbi:nitronate monooxygenase [Spongiibacter sp. KMU-166]|uniref:Nitronate monooxygenase n=1 Tax=Spongiibacter thalassae TaxID=2721624 RepID=A0ABX1GAL3_9GAMM|nr:nitronate monooxygenase [Spongiibacter thalassae]